MGLRRLVLLAVGAMSVAACGASDPAAVSPSIAPAPGTTPPTSTTSTTAATSGHPSANPTVPATSASVPSEPFDCSTMVDGASLLEGDPATIDEIGEQLALMRELHRDTVLIWEEFGIQPDHLMVDGLPTMLIPADDAGDRCEEIVMSVEQPHLVRVVEWSEDDYAQLYEHGSPPWRRLLEAEIGTATDDPASRRWTEMGTGMHGITSVVLKPGEESLAADLAERYGPLVELHVGNFPYDPGGDGADLCADLPDDTARAELSVDDARVVGDAVLFDITNGGTSTVHLVPERVTELAEVDGDRTVTAFTGAMTAEGRPSTEVPPGGTETVRGELSLAACDRSTGTAVQPGAYDATLVIRVFDQPSFEGEASAEILIARHTIELP